MTPEALPVLEAELRARFRPATVSTYLGVARRMVARPTDWWAGLPASQVHIAHAVCAHLRRLGLPFSEPTEAEWRTLFATAADARQRARRPVARAADLRAAIRRARVELPAPYREPVVRFLVLGWYAGLRTGSILGLRWRDIDRGARKIYIGQAKGGRPYTVPLARALDEYLEPPGRPDDPIVPIPPRTLRRILRFLGLAAHALRRGFATRLLLAGVPLGVVCRLMHHADPATTLGYFGPDDEALRRAVDGAQEQD